MTINENSILAKVNPLTLLAGGALICILAYLCARKYKNTNDFAKSTALFLPLALVLNVVLVAYLEISVILTVGLDICGFITLALISNYYFYH